MILPKVTLTAETELTERLRRQLCDEYDEPEMLHWPYSFQFWGPCEWVPDLSPQHRAMLEEKGIWPHPQTT